MPTIVLKELAFAATQRKIVVFRIDRKDLPHLTISWNNPSGEIDVHLTPAAPTGPDDRISILKVKESEAEGFCESLVKEIIELLKSSDSVRITWNVKPNWLAKHHYYLLSPKNESLEDWIRRAAPKVRGKHRFDAEALARIPKHQLRYPNRASWVRVQKEGQFFAICKDRRQGSRVLMGLPWKSASGSDIWIGVDWQDAQAVNDLLQRFLKRRFRSIATKEIKQIYRALRLREIGM